MSTTALPDVIDALVTLAKASIAATTATVYDGTGASDDPGDYLMIGVDDPESTTAARSGTAQQDWANIGYEQRSEAGDVQCAALSWNGSPDGQKLARDSAYALVSALGDALRLNPSLGVPTLLWTSMGTSFELSQLQSADGVLAMVMFTVHYEARV